MLKGDFSVNIRHQGMCQSIGICFFVFFLVNILSILKKYKHKIKLISSKNKTKRDPEQHISNKFDDLGMKTN